MAYKHLMMVVAAILLSAGAASAFTQTQFYFEQNNGFSSVMTYAQVEGNYWDWPNAPIAETPTAYVQTKFTNEGALSFQQSVTQFGTGLQWPDIATPGEWSMQEVQSLEGMGSTQYEKTFSVWTVHEGWSTDYEGAGQWDAPEGFNSYAFSGTTFDTAPTNFAHLVNTDSSFNAGSTVWVNPFVI